MLKEVPEDLIDAAVAEAIAGMTESNKPVAEAMQKVPVHAATDVTGFGLKGHAGNMAMLGKVDIVIDQLAVIRGTPVLAELVWLSASAGRSEGNCWRNAHCGGEGKRG